MDELTLDEILQCSVCLDRLSINNRVLPCQHTFCQKCLEHILHIRKRLVCPECRRAVRIDICNLPSNVLLKRILGRMKEQPSESANNSASNSITEYNIKEPHGIATRDFVAYKPDRLNFSQGDVIFLSKKLKNNWFEGECKGMTGAFPGNFIKIRVPLPEGIPQCEAITSFNEKCLTFEKGDKIDVIRRVDDHWMEGSSNGNIGIFPSNFVKMNASARALKPQIPLESNSDGQSSNQSLPPYGLQLLEHALYNGSETSDDFFDSYDDDDDEDDDSFAGSAYNFSQYNTDEDYSIDNDDEEEDDNVSVSSVPVNVHGDEVESFDSVSDDDEDMEIEGEMVINEEESDEDNDDEEEDDDQSEYNYDDDDDDDDYSD